jgi:hypothetical protein
MSISEPELDLIPLARLQDTWLLHQNTTKNHTLQLLQVLVVIIQVVITSPPCLPQTPPFEQTLAS